MKNVILIFYTFLISIFLAGSLLAQVHPDKCARVIDETIHCDSTGITYTFTVQNITGKDVDLIYINNVQYPSGVVPHNGIFGPYSIHYPASANNTIQCLEILLITVDLECCHYKHYFDLACPSCVDVVSDSIVCLPNGDYKYYMTVYNNDPINAAVDVLFGALFPTAPFINITPQAPNIPANSSMPICATIQGPLSAGFTVDFKVSLKFLLGDSLACCTDTFAVVLPECDSLKCPKITDYYLECLGDQDGNGFTEYELFVTACGGGTIAFVNTNVPTCGSFQPMSIAVPSVLNSVVFEKTGSCNFLSFFAISYLPDGTLCWEEYFELDFPKPCPPDPLCLCENLKADVAAGFNDQFNCPIGTFTPNALIDPCDKVTWCIDGNGVQDLGTSVGNAPFQYTFPNPGPYDICMKVIRNDWTNQVECYDRFCIDIEISEDQWCLIPGPSSETKINVFPNPVEDHFTIDLGNFLLGQSIMVRILDAKGKVFFEEERTTEKTMAIDASLLPNGVFFLQLEGADRSSVSRRIVKLN